MEKRQRARVRGKGQITIPASVRRSAGIEEGSTVELELRPEGLLLRPSLIIEANDLDDAFIRQVIAETTEGYAALRADDVAWKAELDERATLDGSTADGLEIEH
ncbi:MAG: AbrB/MazE/SpoVT family DNA-binding domain-containing protein [Actinobacteria bacterium]|nr:AbrB/MazE/SpoVT family DNA-binding domain-containing protein [Actinomycetota bacterium]